MGCLLFVTCPCTLSMALTNVLILMHEALSVLIRGHEMPAFKYANLIPHRYSFIVVYLTFKVL